MTKQDLSYLRKYDLVGSDKVTFKQPVYSRGSSGNVYTANNTYSAAEVTETALKNKKAWFKVVVKEAPKPVEKVTTPKAKAPEKKTSN